MQKSLMKSSTPKLSEVARHVVIPEGIVTTAWPRVVAKLAEIGVVFDSWQHGIGAIALGKRADGKYAATVGGVVLSIPRQVGKTFLVGMIVIALCLIYPGLTVLWTAHRTRTATKTFQTLQGMVRRKKIAAHLADGRNDGIRSANGEQEIAFRNGSRIMFGAREQGFGRGFDEVDVEVFDEAQILSEKALEDMVPAANQSRQPAGALLFFMGTPPRVTDPGDEFTNRRTKALSGAAKNMVYVEFSADPDAALDDRRQWAKANPSFPLRTPVESMERMREQLTDDDSFRHEALGIWDDPDKVVSVIPVGRWVKNEAPEGALIGSPVISVDLRTGLNQALAIGVAGSTVVDGVESDLVAVAHYHLGVNELWARDYAVSEVERILADRGLDYVVCDSFGDGNGVLIPQLEAAGIRVVKLSSVDMRSGTVGFIDGNLNGRILHKRNEQLTVSVAAAKTRKSSEGQLWAQHLTAVDITNVRAVTAAWWVHHSTSINNYDVLNSVF